MPKRSKTYPRRGAEVAADGAARAVVRAENVAGAVVATTDPASAEDREARKALVENDNGTDAISQ